MSNIRPTRTENPATQVSRFAYTVIGQLVTVVSSLAVTALLAVSSSNPITRQTSWIHQWEAILGIMLLIWGIGAGIALTRPGK